MALRFASNAPGDFYVVDQCCLTCGVMHDVAPDLIAWHNFEPDDRGYVSSHCYVSRQPETLGEIAQMLRAMNVMDLDCLRYGGDDPGWLTRLVENGHSEQCDKFGPGDYPWLARSDD